MRKSGQLFLRLVGSESMRIIRAVSKHVPSPPVMPSSSPNSTHREKKTTKPLYVILCFPCQAPKMRLSPVLETSQGELRPRLMWWMTWHHAACVSFLPSYIFGYFLFLLKSSHSSSLFFIHSKSHTFISRLDDAKRFLL